ncbi:hypothetical protein HRH25_07445 [Flavisolibacter sp. BT320]|nr:hypothetical protein [Flavisolibacter longurius]
MMDQTNTKKKSLAKQGFIKKFQIKTGEITIVRPTKAKQNYSDKYILLADEIVSLDIMPGPG